MPHRTCEIRTAKRSEAERIHDFHQTKNDVNVLPRPLKDLRESAERGLFFVAETNATLIAVSGGFDLGPIPYVELGGTFVDGIMRGFGIQELLLRLRIASVILNQRQETSKRGDGAVASSIFFPQRMRGGKFKTYWTQQTSLARFDALIKKPEKAL